MSYQLEFIRDEDLYLHVKNTIAKYRFKIDFEKLNANLLDPIKLTFDSAIYYGGYANKHLRQILENEVQRQIDKSNTNHIGYFHQNIFHYIGRDAGWRVAKNGHEFDIENSELQIYVEMKNKHNTMNSASAAKTFSRMQNKILHNSQATCFLVEAIAKRSQNIPWACTIDKVKISHPSIRRVSLDKFYEIVTGDSHAFSKLCAILPVVIQDVLHKEKEQIIENTVLHDIQKEKIENILSALYFITFRRYQGFDGFVLELP